MPSQLKSAQITILGDFGSSATLNDMKRWIAHAGGTYSSRVTARTTHLVCSAKHWDAKHAVVVNAMQKYGKKIAIVNYDWLEDCLLKKRMYVPRKYDWRKDAVKGPREERLRELLEGLGVSLPVKTDGGQKKAKMSVEKELSKARYAIYEKDGKKYDITLMRNVPGKDCEEKYRIRLYINTTTKGRVYATTMTYYKIVNGAVSKVSKTEYLGGAERGSTWETAFEVLAVFVQRKTGVLVQELLSGIMTMTEGEWTVKLCGGGGNAGESNSRQMTGEKDQEHESGAAKRDSIEEGE